MDKDPMVEDKNNVVLMNANQVTQFEIDEKIKNIIEFSEVKETFQYVYSVWPGYNDTIIRLSHYLLDVIPGINLDSLFEECLKSAEKEVMNVIDNKPISGFITKIKEAFMKGLISPTSHFLKYEVGIINNERKIIWEPSKETMYDFYLKNNKKPYVLMEKKGIDPDYSRNFIATHIYDHKMLKHINPKLHYAIPDEL